MPLKDQNNYNSTLNPDKKSKKEFGLLDPVRWIFAAAAAPRHFWQFS